MSCGKSLENRVFAIVNGNAKSVTPSFINQFRKRANGIEIRESRSITQLKEIADEVITSGGKIVASVGGDGTLYRNYNALLHAARHHGSEVPQLAIVKKGTGNALANVVGASRFYKKQLQSLGDVLPTKRIPMIEITYKKEEKEQDAEEKWSSPKYFSFAGSGLDATILNDYNELMGRKTKKGRKIFPDGALGYFISIFGKTFWKELRKDKFADVEIKCRGEIYEIHKGMETEKLDMNRKQDIKNWSAPVHSVVVGTTPFYGYGFKGFPLAHVGHDFAGGMFQMRICSGPPQYVGPHLATHIPGLYTGKSGCRYLKDFLSNDISLEYFGQIEESPFHIGGEDYGKIRAVRYKFSEEVMELVDFRKTKT